MDCPICNRQAASYYYNPSTFTSATPSFGSNVSDPGYAWPSSSTSVWDSSVYAPNPYNQWSSAEALTPMDNSPTLSLWDVLSSEQSSQPMDEVYSWEPPVQPTWPQDGQSNFYQSPYAMTPMNAYPAVAQSSYENSWMASDPATCSQCAHYYQWNQSTGDINAPMGHVPLSPSQFSTSDSFSGAEYSSFLRSTLNQLNDSFFLSSEMVHFSELEKKVELIESAKKVMAEWKPYVLTYLDFMVVDTVIENARFQSKTMHNVLCMVCIKDQLEILKYVTMLLFLVIVNLEGSQLQHYNKLMKVILDGMQTVESFLVFDFPTCICLKCNNDLILKK